MKKHNFRHNGTLPKKFDKAQQWPDGQPKTIDGEYVPVDGEYVAAAESVLEEEGGAAALERALVDDGDAVAEHVGLLQVVGGQQDGAALAQLQNDVPDLHAVVGVHAGRRLVQDDRPGAGDEGDRHFQAAAQAARQRRHVVVGVLAQAHFAQHAVGREEREGKRRTGSETTS